MSVNKIIDFIFENYYKRIAFSRENNYCSLKHLKKKRKKKFAIACKQINRKNT